MVPLAYHCLVDSQTASAADHAASHFHVDLVRFHAHHDVAESEELSGMWIVERFILIGMVGDAGKLACKLRLPFHKLAPLADQAFCIETLLILLQHEHHGSHLLTVADKVFSEVLEALALLNED